MLAIIGGTGLYAIDGLEDIKEQHIETPFGAPSAPLLKGRLNGQDVIFLPRHGRTHHLLPSEVNYKANIYALKKAGVRKVLSVSAVGSLREEIRTGDICIVDQYFDWALGKREKSFFGEGVIGHVSTAKPVCPALYGDVLIAFKRIEQPVHEAKTLACIEGPRFGTKAESLFLRQTGCDIVGMTSVPEAFLAREAQMAYCTIAISTDYDAWKADEGEYVDQDQVNDVYGRSVGIVQKFLKALLESPLSETPKEISNCLAVSMITKEQDLPFDKREIFVTLKK